MYWRGTLPSPVFVLYLPQQLVYPVAFNFEHSAKQHAQFTGRETAFVVHPLQVANGHVANKCVLILAEWHAGIYTIN